LNTLGRIYGYDVWAERAISRRDHRTQANEYITLSGNRSFVPGQNDLSLLLSTGHFSQPAGGIMFTGLCAFPLTPLHQQNIDEKAFIRILARLTDAGVDSLGILGSTGSYAYLSREQRKRVVQVAKAHAGSIPMMVGVGAIATSEVLRLVEDAQQAGADALLLPMMSYQPLLRRRSLPFTKVCRHVSVPVCLYDNPRTTHVTLADELQGRIAALPAIASIKIPGLPAPQASERVAALRRHLPAALRLA
jgi:4-hydroxy-tetrahydrodipicolinate synthase